MAAVTIDNISLTGWVHAALTLVALTCAIVILAQRKGTRIHKRLGRVFVVTLAAGSVLSLTIYRRHVFYSPHWFAVAALVSLALGWSAARLHWPARRWRQVHLTAMLFAFYDIVGGGINEAFVRVRWLREDAPASWLGGSQFALALAMLAAVLALNMSTKKGGSENREVELADYDEATPREGIDLAKTGANAQRGSARN